MNISKHDKNLVQLLMIAEILTKSILTETERLAKTAPDGKAGQYAEIDGIISPLHSQIVSLNDAMTDEIHKVLTEEDQMLLVDSALSICVMLETQSPKQINKLMKGVGIRDKDIVDSYFSEGGNICE